MANEGTMEDCISVYEGYDNLVVFYCNPDYGPEWPSMSIMIVLLANG